MIQNKESTRRDCNALQKILESLYLHFCKDPQKANRYAEDAIQYLHKQITGLMLDIPIRLLKGGTYKIKNYYLEDNHLSDIRGASALITQVQEQIVPQKLERILGFSCVAYNGGGNLLAIVPANCPSELGNVLENEAESYLITANTAYILSEEMQLSALLGDNYSHIVARLERQLTERKKTKFLSTVAPKSQFLGERIKEVRIDAEEMPFADKYCSRCKKRLAWYHRNDVLLCGGCLHKLCVGNQEKSVYLQQYQDYVRNHPHPFEITQCSSLQEIDKDYIAVLYADGNNMGGILQELHSVNEMMDFSWFVKEKISEIVYGALYQEKVISVEFTALGGDDIFLLLPGKQAFQVATAMVERYHNVFGAQYPHSNPTLSAGICIAKPNTPVKIMLESAEEELLKAKALVKDKHLKSQACSGSLSYVILDSYEGANGERGRWTLLPYTLDTAKDIMQYVSALKQSETSQTRLRSVASAFRSAESDVEASLFFSYLNAKNQSNPLIRHEKLGDYRLVDGFYQRGDEQPRCVWEDLLDLIKFTN